MVCFNRILMLGLILCLSRAPIPWGHSHSGMKAEQLAIHLHKYHPATNKNELPKGWHWHATRIDLSTDGEAGGDPVAILQVNLGEWPLVLMPDATNAAFTAQTFLSRHPVSTDMAWAHAVCQQQTYLRLNVLLI